MQKLRDGKGDMERMQTGESQGAAVRARRKGRNVSWKMAKVRGKGRQKKVKINK